jgi:hypothetical protein
MGSGAPSEKLGAAINRVLSWTVKVVSWKAYRIPPEFPKGQQPQSVAN